MAEDPPGVVLSLDREGVRQVNRRLAGHHPAIRPAEAQGARRPFEVRIRDGSRSRERARWVDARPERQITPTTSARETIQNRRPLCLGRFARARHQTYALSQKASGLPLTGHPYLRRSSGERGAPPARSGACGLAASTCTDATTSRPKSTSVDLAQTDDLCAIDTSSSARSNSAMSRRPSREDARVARTGTNRSRALSADPDDSGADRAIVNAGVRRRGRTVLLAGSRAREGACRMSRLPTYARLGRSCAENPSSSSGSPSAAIGTSP